jgi:hypothetical protein
VTPTLDGSDAAPLQGVPTQAEPGADDVPLGAISIEADGVGPPLGDNVGSPCRDLLVRGIDSSTPGQTTSGDTIPAPKSSGAMGLGLIGLLLSGYPDNSFLPVNLGQVENTVEQACSQVKDMKRML